MEEPKKAPARSEIDKKDMWAISDIYESDEAWKKELSEANDYANRVKTYAGRLSESAETLLEYMQLNDEISEKIDALANYAQRKSDEDTRVAEYQEMSSQLMRFVVELQSSMAFETPELIKIPADVLEKFYEEKPELKLYKLAIDRVLRKKEHVLSDAQEELLARTGEIAQSPDNIFSMLNDADLTFGDAIDSDGKMHHVSHGSFISLMQSYDRTLRKSAFESLYKEYEKFANTSAAIISAQMNQLLFYANARKYNSTLEAALDNTEVPTSVYQNLIDTVNKNMEPMHRYVAMRKKALGVDELHMYDLYAPMVKDVDMKFTFEEAKELAIKALAPMGEDYINLLKEGFEGGWIDVYENQGKRSGAYSAGARVHPFVLLNFNGTLDDVFTLVHEMGHAIHSYLSNKNQPIVYSEYVIFVAEVASTCNEALLMEYLLSVTDDKAKRAYVINHFLEQFRGTLYRQTMFAEFELGINEMMKKGDGLTSKALCKRYRDLQEIYFGKDITIDSQIDYEWSRIPHFYMNYYVYQYSTGYAAAIALSKRILEEGKPAIDDYINFLSSGNSKDPISLLKGAGVDMSSPKPIENAIAVFNNQLDEMEKLL